MEMKNYSNKFGKMWRSLEWQKLHNSLHALKKKLLPVLVWIIWNLKMRLQTVIWRKTQLTVSQFHGPEMPQSF